MAPRRTEGIHDVREDLYERLSDNPKNTKARIALAKSYFEDGYYGFCLRELAEISTDSDEIRSLITKIKSYLGEGGSGGGTEGSQVKTLAEIEV